jgi:hypothetical protein
VSTGAIQRQFAHIPLSCRRHLHQLRSRPETARASLKNEPQSLLDDVNQVDRDARPHRRLVRDASTLQRDGARRSAHPTTGTDLSISSPGNLRVGHPQQRSSGATVGQRRGALRAAAEPIPPVGVIEQVPCPDDALCAEEFGLNGRIYSPSCRLIDPAAVDLDNELGQGRAFGREGRANALRSDPSFDVIAMSAPPSAGCSEHPDPNSPTSEWQFAWTGTLDTSIICTLGLLTPVEAAADGCDQ